MEQIGKTKGIESHNEVSGRANSKKKKNDARRINELVDLKTEQLRNDLRKAEEKYHVDIDYMQQQLREEQMNVNALQNELTESREFTEVHNLNLYNYMHLFRSEHQKSIPE